MPTALQPYSASAPGKIILFGEHAVVYGQPAIAVPFPTLTATAEARPAPAGVGLTVISGRLSLRVHPEDETHDNALAFAAVLALKYLRAAAPDLTVEIHSNIPVGGGFGSGAAVSAALMRAIAGAHGRILDDDELNPLVYEVEKLHHGTPSGIDNTVIVKKKPVFFERGRPIETFKVHRPMVFLVAYTGIGASTRQTIADVRRLYESDPVTYGAILERIGAIAREARYAFEHGHIRIIGRLMYENHDLLRKLTVSSYLLDKLIGAAREAGALGAKLSGGGRGGNVIVLSSPGNLDRDKKALNEVGAAKVWHFMLK